MLRSTMSYSELKGRESEMMRALIISPFFPPRADAEAFCGGKFVQGLLDENVEPTVICCHQNITPAYRFDTSSCWKPLESVTVDIPNPAQLPLARRCWLGLRYQTTTWTGWTGAVVRTARELHLQRPFDFVVSRSNPWHAHLAGYWVASELRIPWIMNLNDPWDFSAFRSDRVSRSLEKHSLVDKLWRRRLLARANIITFPCERLRDYVLRGTRRRVGVHVIPHIGAASKASVGGSRFAIVHAGAMHRRQGTGRRADTVIDGLADLFKSRPTARSRTRLVFVGAEDAGTMQYAADLGLSEVVACTGQVSYEASLQYIADATVALLIEANFATGIFLPSKLCDYIAAGKPVLALSPAVGTVNDLARDAGIIRVDPDDGRRVSEALRTLFDAFVRGELAAYAAPQSVRQRFEAGGVITRFLELLTSSKRIPQQHIDDS